MNLFGLPHDEVFVYVDGKKKTVAFIDGHPFESEVKEWVSDFNADKITVEPAKGKAYTIYDNGKIMNCKYVRK